MSWVVSYLWCASYGKLERIQMFGCMCFFYLFWWSCRCCRGTNVTWMKPVLWKLRRTQYARSVFHFPLCIHSGLFFICSTDSTHHSHMAQRCQYLYHAACRVGLVEASATPLWLRLSIADQVGFTWLGGWCQKLCWPRVMAVLWLCGGRWVLKVNGSMPAVISSPQKPQSQPQH